MFLHSSLSKFLSRAVALTLLTSALSLGAIIYDSGSLSLAASSPVQKGRLSRSGVPSDWSSLKAFPGALNPTISYHYATYVVPTSAFPYLQVSFYDETGSTNVFAAAYLNSYNPTGVGTNLGLDINYLGDAGSSGNLFGNPASFQVKLPSLASSLVIVVNDSSPGGAGIGQGFDFLVEGFYDTSFNDTTPVPSVPEPASFALSGAGLAIAGIAMLRRRKNAA